MAATPPTAADPDTVAAATGPTARGGRHGDARERLRGRQDQQNAPLRAVLRRFQSGVRMPGEAWPVLTADPDLSGPGAVTRGKAVRCIFMISIFSDAI